MDVRTFDRLTSLLSRFSSRRATLGGLSALILPGLVDAGKKRRKRKRKGKRRRCRPEPRATTCADVHCGEARVNNCGQEVSCGCPSGFTCLLSGTCARECDGSHTACAGCGSNVFCTAPNTEGQMHCIYDSRCSDHPVCFTSTGECPRGTQCQPCGIGQGNYCLPVAACLGK
jgi:hypothetical protein